MIPVEFIYSPPAPRHAGVFVHDAKHTKIVSFNDALHRSWRDFEVPEPKVQFGSFEILAKMQNQRQQLFDIKIKF